MKQRSEFSILEIKQINILYRYFSCFEVKFFSHICTNIPKEHK